MEARDRSFIGIVVYIFSIVHSIKLRRGSDYLIYVIRRKISVSVVIKQVASEGSINLHLRNIRDFYS